MNHARDPAWRAQVVRHFKQLGLPLYQAALRGDAQAIRTLVPAISMRRAAVMIHMARAFRPLESGWFGEAFYTVSFDPTWGVWRRERQFDGPVAGRCAICARPAVYKRRDTLFCRMHGPLEPRATGPAHLTTAVDTGVAAGL